jgi:hypothetical protein
VRAPSGALLGEGIAAGCDSHPNGRSPLACLDQGDAASRAKPDLAPTAADGDQHQPGARRTAADDEIEAAAVGVAPGCLEGLDRTGRESVELAHSHFFPHSD